MPRWYVHKTRRGIEVDEWGGSSLPHTSRTPKKKGSDLWLILLFAAIIYILSGGTKKTYIVETKLLDSTFSWEVDEDEVEKYRNNDSYTIRVKE